MMKAGWIRRAAVRGPVLVAGLALPLAGVADDGGAEDAPPPPELPALGTLPETASVVGVGSGGYMATQLAVAWPEVFHGLGVLGAGPWACAQGKLSLALNQCMMVRRGEPSLAALDARRADYQSRGQLGTDADLEPLRAYVWHGQRDEVIAPVLGDLLAEQLKSWLPEGQVRAVSGADAGHGWPDNAAEVAGEMMDWLYPSRSSREVVGTGELRRFDQGDFDARGLADTGYVYVPEACTDGGCGTTLALHGCEMNAEALGEGFIRESGLSAWADAHGEVVLYPQAESTLANPRGCWDWWGFAESSWQLYPLHDTRDGTQTGALINMLERLQQDIPQQDMP